MRSPRQGIAAVSAVLVFAACSASDPVPVIEREIAPPPRRVERLEREHYLGMAVPEHEPVPVPNIRGECEPGETRLCSPEVSLPTFGPVAMHCRKAPNGIFQFDRSDCATPLVVAFDEAPISFTKPAGTFTVGPFERTEWVSARTPWLALDSDGTGCVEGQGELFRFDRLASLDDDHDGRIDEHDQAYLWLALWFDRDQDRRCSPGEMVGLAEAGIVSLEVRYEAPSRLVFGSHEGEHAAILFRTPGNELRRGRLVDVYLAPLP